MNELSRLIKSAANLNSPSSDYFDNFLHSYKAYHNRQNVRRTVFKIVSTITAIIVMSVLSLSFIDKLHQKTLDIQTASGVEDESK